MTIQENRAARGLFLQESFGVLSTISIDMPGYPFGSVTPYCVDNQCRPIIYISHIAQHTRNILADSRVSLTVVEGSGGSNDVQARSRVTCVANVRSVMMEPTLASDTSDTFHPHVSMTRRMPSRFSGLSSYGFDSSVDLDGSTG